MLGRLGKISMKHKPAEILIRTVAREDILRQYSYYLVEKGAPAAAQRFLDSVQSATERICKAPGMGAPKILGNPTLAGLRSWPVAGFPAMRIYYLCAGNVVRVVRVLHGKRDITALLEKETTGEE